MLRSAAQSCKCSPLLCTGATMQRWSGADHAAIKHLHTDMVDERVALDIYRGSKQCQVAEIHHSESNNHLLSGFRTDRPLHVSELPTD